MDKAPGVLSTTVGYIGGHRRNPTYEEVKSHKTGHYEAIRVEFDPAQTSYEELCKLFFEIHDPAQLDGQGPDLGPQYLSGIFFTSGLQKSKAEEVMALLRRRGYEVNTFIAPAASITTPDTPVDQTFWPAEDYHQHYYEKTGGSPYCHFRTKKF